MIQNIEISCLRPHKDNPRKDLGDIAELAESIKATGILQNLTVVPYVGELTKQPWDGVYTVVIGHRRLAAAKLAGLTEVPCSISNMDYKEQIATMLLENMQRSDLTIYEQAEGFQMMLDLGESVDGISKKTGFSETTVRRRMKLLELDKDKFKKSVERGATLMDYVELEKIKDIELRNQVLEKIGTNNFDWELRNALDKLKREDTKVLIIAELEKFATLITNSAGMRCVNSYYSFEKNVQVKVPDDAGEVKYYFTTSEYGPVTLFKKLDAAEAENESAFHEAEEAARKAKNERYEALGYVSDQAFSLRKNFVRELSNFTVSKHIDSVIKCWIKESMSGGYLRCPDANEIADLLDADCDDKKELKFEDIEEILNERALLVYVYLSTDNDGKNYYDYACRFKENPRLDSIYAMLIDLGYEMSDTELALKNGTHELFLAKEGGEEK